MTPEEIAERQFSSARRGYDRDEVRAFLASISAHLVEIEARASLAEPSDPYEGIGQDVSSVLRAAEEWSARTRVEADQDATEIRVRAGTEADELRAESDALRVEAEQMVKTVAADKATLEQRTIDEELRLKTWSQEQVDGAQADADQILSTAQTDAESIRREAQDAASIRSREILTASQAELDRLLAAQTDVHDRLESALADAQSAVETVSSSDAAPAAPDIDLTLFDDANEVVDDTLDGDTSDEDSDGSEGDSDDTGDVADTSEEGQPDAGDDEGSDRLAEVVRDAVSRALRERS
jgi:DivIVA domain-containing protein